MIREAIAAGALMLAQCGGGEELKPNPNVVVVAVDRVPHEIIVSLDAGVGWWDADLLCYNYFGQTIWHNSPDFFYDWRWGQQFVGVPCPPSHPFLYNYTYIVYSWK